MNPRSVEDWNAVRTDLLAPTQRSKTQHDGVPSLIASCHWLTLVCFIEHIDPESLALAPELLTRVRDERMALRECDPLVCYWAVLDRLSMDDRVTVDSGGVADAASE
jgi:hypothetical protein